jgi:virginiamycin B lyase
MGFRTRSRRSSAAAVAAAVLGCLAAAPAQAQDELRLRTVTIPAAVARGITVGPDDRIWFAGDTGPGFYGRPDLPGGYIGRIDPRTRRLRTFKTPTPGSGPESITTGPDGALWFTERNAAKVGRITTSGRITEFPLPAGSLPRGITRGPDGALWVTLFGTGQVARVTTSGQVTVFTQGLTPGGQHLGIALGPDRAVWLTEPRGDRILRMAPNGTVRGFGVSNESGPEAIARSRDGSMYFTEDDGDRVGRVTRAGQVEEWPVSAGSNPSGIAQGPDDAMWFAEHEGSRMGRVTSGGVVTEYELPAGSHPFNVVTGPDGRIWATFGYARKVVSFAPPLAPVVGAAIPFTWRNTGSGYRFTRLRVTGIPADGRVRLTCRGGCNVRVTREGVRSIDLRARIPSSVRPGMRIEVRVSAPGLTTKVRSFTATSSEIVDRDRCIAPRTTRLRSCPED